MTFSYFTSLFLSITNMVVRNFIYKIIDLIRFDSLSSRTSSIITAIFFTTFINSGIIMLFTNANLKYSILSFIPIYRQHTDIGKDWYLEFVPQIILNQIFAAFWPWIEIVIYGGLKQIYRIIDRGSPGKVDPNKATKKKTPQ